MKKKNDEDGIFSFTLIDLLVQIIFLGIFVFAITGKQNKEKLAKVDKVAELERQVAQYKEESGKYKELTDRLTTLSPNYNEYLKDLENKKKKGGLDKPSCLFNSAGEIQRLSSVEIIDDRIVFKELTPELDVVLKDLKYDYEKVKSLNSKAFVANFSKVKSYQKDCVYYLAVCEKTKDLALRDAVESSFYKILTCQKSKSLVSAN